MSQQRFVAEVATLGDMPPPRQVLVVSRDACAKHMALHPDRPDPLMALNKGILHFWPFAKYAVAFPRMSRSIVTRANSARKRLISICSAVTPALPLTSFSLPSRFAFTQLDSVCSTTPRLRAAAAMPLARLHQPNRLLLKLQRVPASFPVPHFVSLSLLQQFAKGYVLTGILCKKMGQQGTKTELRSFGEFDAINFLLSRSHRTGNLLRSERTAHKVQWQPTADLVIQDSPGTESSGKDAAPEYEPAAMFRYLRFQANGVGFRFERTLSAK